MPYARKYRTTARDRRRKYARRAAASTLQKAWRARARRKRGSLVVRTVKANRKAIKAIKRDVELKFVNSAVASARTNYIGNILSSTKVDSWGFAQSSLDWVSAGGAATQLPNSASYCPLILQPIVVPQAGQLIPGGTTQVYASTEDTRVGNDITMSHLTMKLTMQGSYANTNGGNYLNVAQKQTVNAILVLDRDPAKAPPSLITATPQFTPENIPCQLMPRTPDNQLALPQLAGTSSVDLLKSAPLASANPPGLATGSIGSKNTDAISFYSKQHVMGPSGRFKVLKKVKLSCYQRQGPSGPNLNGSLAPTDNSLSLTYKGKYKFHFDADEQIIPGNQNLLIFLYSSTPTVRSAGGAVPANFVAPPTVTVLSRFSYRDS